MEDTLPKLPTDASWLKTQESDYQKAWLDHFSEFS